MPENQGKPPARPPPVPRAGPTPRSVAGIDPRAASAPRRPETPHPAAAEPSAFDFDPPSTPRPRARRATPDPLTPSPAASPGESGLVATQTLSPGGRWLARVQASLAIWRLRAADAVRGVVERARQRPRAAALAGAVAVLVLAGGVAGIVAAAGAGVPDVAGAREEARARPTDAGAQLDLGHALWKEGKQHEAVASYERALAMDPSVADGRMVENLVASFGGKDQRTAEDLIWKNKLVAAQDGLEALVTSDRYGVRWGAVRTLDKLEKGSLANWESAYIADLGARDCRISRTAVEKLAEIGTDRAVTALRAAAEAEKKSGVPKRRRCLGDRPAKAERKILARG